MQKISWEAIKVYSNNMGIYVLKYHQCDSTTTSKPFDGEYNLTRERVTVCIHTHVYTCSRAFDENCNTPSDLDATAPKEDSS